MAAWLFGLLGALAPVAGEPAAPGLAAAVFAGLVSFLSPCVLPLVPSYLAVLGGAGRPARGALGFVLGFALVFVALGASASALGGLLLANRPLLNAVGGGLILAFGLGLLLKERLPFLAREYRADLGRASRYGPVALGAAFAADWTPCVGLTLGPILALAAGAADLGRGVALLAAYALGLALPFLAAAFAWSRLAGTARRAGRLVPALERLGGAVLVVAGLLLLTGEFTRLAAALQAATPEWLRALL